MLIIESIARDSIIDAMWSIDRMNYVGYRAIELNEAINKGLLSEGKSALLLEDLDKAKDELAASGQTSLQKIDKALGYIENFVKLSTTGKAEDNDIFDIMNKSFLQAKEIVQEFSALKPASKIQSIKSFFSEGGRISAILDALAQEMKILSQFVKVLSAGFAQLIRVMQQVPSDFKDTQEGKDLRKGDTLKAYIQAADNNTGKEFNISPDECESGILAAMNDVKEKGGGAGIFSFKGIKNFFSNNAGSAGIGAFLGGLGALGATFVMGPIGLAATAGIAATTGLAAGTLKNRSRQAEEPAEAYGTKLAAIAKAMMATKVAKLEGNIPAFVKAVKGVKVAEFAKAAADAAKVIQTINDGFNVDEVVSKFIDKFGGDEKYKAMKDIQDLGEEGQKILKSIVSGVMTDYDEQIEKYKDTTIYDALKQLKKEYLSESSWRDGELILENGEQAHDYSMTELLFEKKRRKKKKKKSSSKNKAGADKGKKSSGVSKPEYKKLKSKMTAAGKKNMQKAEKKPESAEKYAKAVDKYEDKVNRKMVNNDRKRNITKIADEFEKKIRALEDEKDTGRDSADDDKKDAAEEEGSGALEMLGMDAGEKTPEKLAKDFERKAKRELRKFNRTVKSALKNESRRHLHRSSLSTILFEDASSEVVAEIEEAQENLEEKLEQLKKDYAAQVDELAKTAAAAGGSVDGSELKTIQKQIDKVSEQIEAKAKDIAQDAEDGELDDTAGEEQPTSEQGSESNQESEGNEEQENKEESPASDADVEPGEFKLPETVGVDIFGKILEKLKSDNPDLKEIEKQILNILYGENLPANVKSLVAESVSRSQKIQSSYDRRFLKLAGIR